MFEQNLIFRFLFRHFFHLTTRLTLTRCQTRGQQNRDWASLEPRSLFHHFRYPVLRKMAMCKRARNTPVRISIEGNIGEFIEDNRFSTTFFHRLNSSFCNGSNCGSKLFVNRIQWNFNWLSRQSWFNRDSEFAHWKITSYQQLGNRRSSKSWKMRQTTRIGRSRPSPFRNGRKSMANRFRLHTTS